MKNALVILTLFFPVLFWDCATTLPTDDGPDFYGVETSVRDSIARTDVYVSIPYEELVFEAAGENRQAVYDVEGTFYYQGVPKSTVLGEQVEVIPLESTDDQSKNIISTHFLSFRGTPGRYKLKLIATDRSTRKSQEKEYDLVLRPIAKNAFDVSDPVFIGRSVRGDNRNAAAPLNPKELDSKQPLAFIFEFYAPESLKTVDLVAHYRILSDDQKGKLAAAYSDTMRNVELTDGKRLITVIRTLPDSLSGGNYILEFWAEIPDHGITHVIRKEIGFFGEWPNSPEEMKMAFGVLEYLSPMAKAAIDEAPTKKEKVTIFYRAITTDDYNLLRRRIDEREFVRRLNYANSQYSTFPGKNDGWQTPRGRIYIKFGMPDNVFDYPTNMRRPYNYKAWYYSSRPATLDKDRLFVFVNKSGNEWRLDNYPKIPELRYLRPSELNNE